METPNPEPSKIITPESNGAAPEAGNKFLLPVTKAPEVALDKKTGMLYIMLPLNNLDNIAVMTILDRCKFDAVSFQRHNEQQSKIIKPSAFQRTRDFLIGKHKV